MSVQSRKRKRGTVHYAVFTWQGKPVWELVGTDKRAAQSVEKERRREVRAGSYVPLAQRTSTTFGQWTRQWLDNRAVRSADDERRWIESYVLPMGWLDALPIEDLKPSHLLRMVEGLKTATSTHTGRRLAAKSIANTYGIVRTIIRDARIACLVAVDPCVLPPKTIARGVTKKRHPYPVTDVRILTTDARLAPDVRAWNALAFYTGMREGEVCGRRWRDYDRDPRPLGCLTVETQYDDQQLKTDHDGDWHPRRVPVHPALAAILADWWASGFHLVHCRRPTLDDFIVPNREGGAHTKSSAYKMWRRGLGAVGVTNRSLHSSRHTTITMARRGGAREEVVERITHNAKGSIVDAYTHWDWAPLCEAVLAINVDENVDGGTASTRNAVEAPGIELGRVDGNGRQLAATRDLGRPGPTLVAAGFERSGVGRGARQGEAGDDVLRVPAGVQRFVAERLGEAGEAVRVGDRGGAEAALEKAARAVLAGRSPRAQGCP